MTVIRHPDRAEEAARLVAEHGGIRAASRAAGVSYQTLRDRYAQAKELGLVSRDPSADEAPAAPARGRVGTTPRVEWELPPEGTILRYIFTCAQSNTHLHDACWKNLQALAAHYEAGIYVSTFTYDLASYGAGSVKRGKEKVAKGEPWYDPRIEPHVLDESVVVAPGLVWCGEMNILPTAVRPLSGLEAYTGRKSGIFPHVKFAMESVASGKHEGTKFNYTTGTVTQRNYIAKKAGQKAEFHHGYGALLVEVDSDGNWFCRQLNADSDGAIYDLDVRADQGVVSSGHGVAGITWGDIHVGTIEPALETLIWGESGVLDTLLPEYQFMHDVLDFRSRNHHDMRNPHKMFEKYINGTDSVVEELKQVCHFLDQKTFRRWCKTVVVDSNHDNALTRWLREADYRQDPANAIFFLEAQAQVYASIRDKLKNFHLLEWAFDKITGYSQGGGGIRFLRPDESFIICADANGGIECGMHGHLGPNGMRGMLQQFARMGRKSNTGHGHSAGIMDGAYRAGITGSLEQGYNAGPSSWSCSHIVTYPNGKRAILTIYRSKKDGTYKWRAEP